MCWSEKPKLADAALLYLILLCVCTLSENLMNFLLYAQSACNLVRTVYSMFVVPNVDMYRVHVQSTYKVVNTCWSERPMPVGDIFQSICPSYYVQSQILFTVHTSV